MQRTAFVLALLALPTCGGTVQVAASAGGTGSGGASSTASSSSSAASGASSSSASSSGTSVLQCGGLAGTICPADAFCHHADHLCGQVSDLGGLCEPKPQGCTADCPGVCGCDGKGYCNECDANAAGVDVGPAAKCSLPGAAYSAVLDIANLDHLILKKADPVRDVCLEVFADSPSTNAAGFAFTEPQMFGVAFAWISNHASDCAASSPTGTPGQAIGGKGTITWTVAPGMHYPCTLSFDAVISFDAVMPWMQATEPMTATNVTVQGGCI